jgi:SAM-dependent methyltransferase
MAGAAMNVAANLEESVLTPRQTAIRKLFDRLAPDRGRWLARNSYFYAADHDYMRFLIPAGARVLEVGCGDGQLLAALKPVRAVGIDFSAEMVRVARERNPTFEFHVGNAEDPAVLQKIEGPFDYIIASGIAASVRSA